MVQECWFKNYGRPLAVMTDPEGCLQEREVAQWSSGQKILPRELHDVHLTTHHVRTCFDNCTEAQNELHQRRGYSPFQVLIGRSPPGLPLLDEKIRRNRCILDHRRETTTAQSTRVVQVVPGEEVGLHQRRREMHRSRPWRLWSSGE